MTDLQKFKQYAEDVLSDKIPACLHLKASCRRYLSWFDREDIEFRADKAEDPVKFIEKLKQFQGKWSGKYLKLEEWQKYFIYGIYGFYYKNTEKRVVRHAVLEVSRKNGKSTLVAGLALYHLINDKEGGTEVDIVAMTRQQAKILFDICSSISKRMDPSGKHIRQTINRVKYDKRDSFIQVLASESAALDGYSSSVYIIDECHNQKDSKLNDVLASSQGSRENPLSIYITTAGYLLSGFYYTDVRPNLTAVLNNTIENDSLFGVIYTLDEGDDYKDKNVFLKAIPNLGVSVSEDYIQDRINNIKSQPSSEIDVKTKTFNIWCQSAETWIADDYIMKTFQKVDLQQLRGELCYGGLDLASVSDMTAFSLMFPPNKQRDYYPDKYIFYSRAYLPEDALVNSVNSQFYKKCKKAGHLFTTPGNVTDYDYILKDMLQLDKQFYIENIAYDAYNSTQFIIDAQDEGLPCEPYAQGLGSFNRPTKELERLILSGKVVIDGSVITRWCFQNVVLKEDINFNQKPIKQNKEQKIDIVICMLEALGVYLMAPNYAFSLDESEE